MFSTDKPISKISEDVLGRSSFAKRLASAIMQFQTKDNYVISLQGKWGCGKTSVINMTIEEIEKLSKAVDENKKPVIVQFNPWNFTNTNQLINQFFITLSNTLKFENKEEKAQKVGAAIIRYSSALANAEYIPKVGKYLQIIPKLLLKYGKLIKENADYKQNDVSYRKNEVEQALRDLDFRTLVVIDDIDRLSNEQIRLIFQLVNAVAGFPNITYLLSFDKDIVSRALGDVQHCDGAEYLEKIIQIPFDLPQLNINKLYDILSDKLKSYMSDVIKLDSERWSNVLKFCINPFINTLRDVNKLYNVFEFVYPPIKEEVDFIDMAGICSLQIFAPEIYEWIRDNKFTLVGGNNSANLLVTREEMLNNFHKSYPKNPEVMLKAVASLFPLFYNKFSVPSIYIMPDELYQEMRISSDSKFDIYFSLSLDEIKISSKEIDDSILHMKEDELRLYINTLDERKLYNSYKVQIQYNLSRIPEDRIELILSVLVFQNGRIANKDTQLIGADIKSLSIYTISDLLFRISDENKRFDIIANMFSNSDFLSFQFLLYLLHIIELTHGRIAETSNLQKPKLISIDHLYQLEEIFLVRTISFVANNNLFDWKELRRASMLWKFIDEKTYSEYVKSKIDKGLNAIKFLRIHESTWLSSGKISSFELTEDSYKKYISTEDLIKIIENSRLTKNFWALDQDIIESSAAFILAKEQPDRRNLIEMEDIKKRIDEWKKEYEQALIGE